MFERFDEHSQWDGEGLIDSEMDMLGHDDVGVDSRSVTGPCFLKNFLYCCLRFIRQEIGQTVKTAKGDEMDIFSLMVTFETPGHCVMVSLSDKRCGASCERPHSSHEAKTR